MFRPTVTTFHRMAARAAASASSTSGGVRVCGGVRSTAVVSSYATPSAALVAAPHAGVSSAVMRAEVGDTLLDKTISPLLLLAMVRLLQLASWLGDHQPAGRCCGCWLLPLLRYSTMQQRRGDGWPCLPACVT
eukprot:TRINITY_DN17_c0_g1_i7.p1 TRINITY_DN17_c0_g1~~TRINITY_DN17_c0_g1_i7.p1  ORF type:complete len:133 (+),score=6.02 TRINITY_DN17_c0_g1_i7:53-451(+)